MKRIRQGNTINFHYSVYRSTGELKEPEDLTGVTLTATLQNRLYSMRLDVSFSVEGNVISAFIPGVPLLKTGVYNFSLSYQKDGWDFAIDADAFQIVDSSAKVGGSDACPDVEAETVELFGIVNLGEFSTPVLPEGIVIDANYVHTDNNYTDEEKKKLSDLQNYDDTALSRKVTALEKDVQGISIPTKTSELENDAEFITGAGLSKVATSGSYADLTGAPTIPTVTNDFTDEEKTKLAGLHNYDDTEVRNLIEKKGNAIPVKSIADPNGSVQVYAIDPNIFYDFDLCGTLHLSLTPPTDRSILNEYMFQFMAADSGTTLLIDGPVHWLNEIPTLKQNYLYQVSIVNNLAIIGGTEYVEI